MTAPPDQDPETAAFSAVLPFVRTTRRTGWLMMGGTLIGLGAVSALLMQSGETAFSWGVSILLVGLMTLPLLIATHVRGKQESHVLPLISRTFGLTHTKSAAHLFNDLPDVFIPMGGRRSADDCMSGQVAGRSFDFAEVKTETGGKNSKTLFRGVVLRVANDRKLPRFVIAATKETQGFLFFKGNVPVEGMEYHDGVSGPDGTFYGLWSRSGADVRALAGIRAFMQRLTEVGPEVLGEGRLYSVACSNGSVFVAISHKRDLFRVGGLLAGEGRVLDDIRTAAAEMGHAIRLVSEVLRAEEALMAAQEKETT